MGSDRGRGVASLGHYKGKKRDPVAARRVSSSEGVKLEKVLRRIRDP